MQPTDAGPAAVLEETLLIDFFHFTLQCVPIHAFALALGNPDGRLRAGPGGAVFRSAATDHYAPVRVELWLAPPPVDTTLPWDQVETGDLLADAPQLRLESVTAWVGDERLALPRLGPYGIRAHVAQTAPIPQELPDDYWEGLERWLVQVWPAG